MNKYRPLLTTCGMYVVKWESSVIDLQIWDNVLILKNCETKASCPCFASARNCNACTALHCYRNGLIDLFPPPFVSSQIAQVDRLRILERVVFSSSWLCTGVFVTSLIFLLKIEDLEKSESFQSKEVVIHPK